MVPTEISSALQPGGQGCHVQELNQLRNCSANSIYYLERLLRLRLVETCSKITHFQ